MIKFKVVSIITAAIAFTLCLVLILIPEVLFMLFNIDENNSAFFIGRRAAMLFLGISVFSWFGRNAEHSESRQAICLSLSVSMFALAFLGSVEYLRGFAGIGILLAVITEASIALLYYKIWLSCNNV
ncbi:hypothetical protein H5154_21305 [Pseudoalteromonas sp. SR44-5]|uniref:DUF4345 domain-containing protein n=2 Tax=Pseudoalteromonas TaxID=53246 RepID=A0ABW8KX37_9GAMM|nr:MULTISPECIES: hypothetical protein [Pseudoalteromonas]MBB1368881.1 hypothetical protein [Pseudoalteromonas sp. SR44-5]MBB1419792.1 hypothetical protein [Pseudoalteromonas sp. SG44-1]MBB1424453.1 hypothetical protein [Pseudoalteromonas sp. SG43-7]MBB1470880.1 hypothetical protein [Pseudoalteromonas sp. SG41-5]MBB1477880.1 hypothetical protein [Pseudoalteromonas sp. SG41-2]